MTEMQYFHPYRCRLGFFPLLSSSLIQMVKGIVRTEEKNVFDRRSTLHAFLTPFWWLSKGLFIWYRTDFHSGIVSFQSPPQVLRFSDRGEGETRVTVDARDYGKEKNERPKFSRERASGCEAVPEWSSYCIDTRIERPSLRSVVPAPDDQHDLRFSMRNKVSFQLPWY